MVGAKATAQANRERRARFRALEQRKRKVKVARRRFGHAQDDFVAVAIEAQLRAKREELRWRSDTVYRVSAQSAAGSPARS